MPVASVSLLCAKLNYRAPQFTHCDEKGFLITQWLLHDVKRYDFDGYLLDHPWQILPTLEDTCNFGRWINPSAHCILHCQDGNIQLTQCHNPELFNAEVERIRAQNSQLMAQQPSAALTKKQFA